MYTHSTITFEADGTLASVGVCELDHEGHIIRANGHWSPLNGTADYEQVFLAGRFSFEARMIVVESTSPYVMTLSNRSMLRDKSEAEIREIVGIVREFDLEQIRALGALYRPSTETFGEATERLEGVVGTGS